MGTLFVFNGNANTYGAFNICRVLFQGLHISVTQNRANGLLPFRELFSISLKWNQYKNESKLWGIFIAIWHLIIIFIFNFTFPYGKWSFQNWYFTIGGLRSTTSHALSDLFLIAIPCSIILTSTLQKNWGTEETHTTMK